MLTVVKKTLQQKQFQHEERAGFEKIPSNFLNMNNILQNN